MNMLRFFKLKKLNGELDDCTEKELYLIKSLAYTSVYCDVDPYRANNEKISYIIYFINNWDDTAFCSLNNRMFGHIHRDVLCGFDTKFYNDMYNIVYHDEFEYWNAYNDTIIYWDVVKILTSLDKKFKISKSIFKSFGLGH